MRIDTSNGLKSYQLRDTQLSETGFPETPLIQKLCKSKLGRALGFISMVGISGLSIGCKDGNSKKSYEQEFAYEQRLHDERLPAEEGTFFLNKGGMTMLNVRIKAYDELSCDETSSTVQSKEVLESEQSQIDDLEHYRTTNLIQVFAVSGYIVYSRGNQKNEIIYQLDEDKFKKYLCSIGELQESLCPNSFAYREAYSKNDRKSLNLKDYNQLSIDYLTIVAETFKAGKHQDFFIKRALIDGSLSLDEGVFIN